MVFYLAVGVFFALTLYPVVRGLALLEAMFARGLLSGVNELREQVAEAEAARDVAQAQKAAAVSAEATALAGRCTVPVDLDAPPIGRLDPAVESPPTSWWPRR